MTQTQIISLIERNKVKTLQLKDYSGNILTIIECKTPEAAIKELEETLPDFVSYRKLEINGKGDKNTPWTKGFTWYFEFEGATAGKPIAGSPPIPTGHIGAIDYINMHTAMMDKNMEMVRENMKLQNEMFKQGLEQKQKDPATWLPIIREIAPALGFNLAPPMQGPPGAGKKKLQFGDVDTSNMTDDQIQEAIAMRMVSLSKKMKGNQFLRLIVAINENPNITMQVDGLTVMLEAIAKNPGLFDMAKSYIK